MQSDSLKQTPLHGEHERLGARLMPFAGFEMPVQYAGIVEEHLAVRQAAGLFDVSHMGEVLVEGPDAFAFVQHLVTNDVGRLTDGRALYTVMCRPGGGIVDDLLVYRRAADRYLLVINAANVASDLAWMREHNPMGATITDASARLALLALQGPRAFAVAEAVTGIAVSEITYYHFRELPAGDFFGSSVAILSHTGYTGERGLEIYVDADRAADVWRALLEAGEPLGLKPAGLGARDTLRLEAGYALYGNDITEATNPLEAGLGWVVKLDKGDFIGREALQAVKERGPERKLIGFVLEERGIPRAGYALMDLDADGGPIGEVTSGSQSPVLGRGIGLGYVPNDPRFTTPGHPIGLRVRGRVLRATVQKPPFHTGA